MLVAIFGLERDVSKDRNLKYLGGWSHENYYVILGGINKYKNKVSFEMKHNKVKDELVQKS